MSVLRRIITHRKHLKSNSLSDIQYSSSNTDVDEVVDKHLSRLSTSSTSDSKIVASPLPASSASSTRTSTVVRTRIRSHRRAKSADGREVKERQARKRVDLDLVRKSTYDSDPLKGNYGPLPLHSSQKGLDLPSASLRPLSRSSHGNSIRFRARIHHSRAVGSKIVFLIFRQDGITVQGVLTEQDDLVSLNMVRWAERLHRESIVYVEGQVQIPQDGQMQIKTTTIHEVEIKVEKLHVITAPSTLLPFQVDDAERTTSVGDTRIRQSTRLSGRVIDLRTPVSHALFRLRAGVTNAFRTFLDSHNFIEIQSSKFQEVSAESGAAVFNVDYFGRPVTLAQSPQIFKQMAIAADMERVYEVGPVFRAENSNTHRHLTEFTGLDLEMAFDSHYHEVLNLIDEMFKHIFETIQTNFRHQIETVKTQYPHEDLVWLEKTPVLKFSEGIQMLIDSGYKEDNGSDPSPFKDLSTNAEQTLGRLVKLKFHTDYYILDKFPASARPFYTMPDPENPLLSNSYDFFIRGEEVLSGSQRIHDAALLEQKIRGAGIDPASMEDYVNSFKWASPPHGGGGIGLERVVMLVLKLGDIRLASLFPRDPRSFPQKKRRFTTDSVAGKAANVFLHGPESRTLVNENAKERPSLENLIARYGDATNTSWLDPAWTVWRDPNTGAAVGYMPQNGFGIVFGNPLCEPKQLHQVVKAFLHHLQHDKKLKPVWCCVDFNTEKVLAHHFGWRALTAVAEERINPLEAYQNSNKHLERKLSRAEKSGVKLFDIEGEVDKEIQKEILERVQAWKDRRKGTQVHLTGVRPFDDVVHRKYFYARDAEGKMCALVVLAQLSVANGFQIKWALEFPGAPLGAIEYILTHVIHIMSQFGIRSATFGAGAAELHRADNIGGFRIVTLEKAYNGLSHTFHLGNKGDFRSKFGVYKDPLYICYPKGGLGVKGVESIMAMLQKPK